MVFGLVAQNDLLLIFLLAFAFLYASLGRAKIFHYNRSAQAIVALVLAIGASGTIYSVHWDQMTSIMAALIAGALVSIVLWSVTLQRGKLRHETDRSVDR